jgi:uracil-DNA glycosylase family 4
LSGPDAGAAQVLAQVTAEVVECRACPRLVAWREAVAAQPRAAYAGQVYWGRPVPGFGDPAARLVVVGLAPAAHGGNRTGRAFTGDRSGDWLYRALWRAGFANQPTSVSADDGLTLTDCWISAAVRCAPPDNKPTPAERDTCSPYLVRELAALRPAVIVCLGSFGYEATWRALRAAGLKLPAPRPRFGHRVEVAVPAPGSGWPRETGPTIICSYHVSQQNTFTGKLTEPMLDAIFERARELLGQVP